MPSRAPPADTKIGGKQILRKGLSPLATTLSTAGSAPVIAVMRLRAGRAASAKGAGRMVAHVIGTARAAGAGGQILVRGDSAYGNRSVVRTCWRAGARFSLAMIRNPTVERALAAIEDNAWTPVCYAGAVQDPDTGAWISDAEVAEIPSPLSRPPPIKSRHASSCAASKTPDAPTRCSGSGGTTRSSPTPICPPNRPTSPTVNTRSSRPSSPI